MDRKHIIEVNRKQYLHISELEAYEKDKVFQDRINDADQVWATRVICRMILVRGHVFDDGVPKKVLDAGCGHAFKRDLLLEMLPYNIEYWGIDALPELAYANKFRGVRHMFIEDIPTTWDRNFEFILANHVLEHCPDADKAVAALSRALSSTGVIGHATPHKFPDNDPAHLTSLDISEWKKVYQKNGLEVVWSEIYRYDDEDCGIPPCAHLVARLR